MKVILTGATGMVGEGVLRVCLSSPHVRKVLLINRRPSGYQHEKITEIIHPDFFDLTEIKEDLKGYDACFFCLGITSVGISKSEYQKITYDLTMYFAQTLLEVNQDNNNGEGKVNIVFNYVSGAGTDSKEKSRMAWARVKGKLENDLLKLPFRDAYMFRPGFIQPIKGQKNVHGWYKPFLFLYPILLKAFPGTVGSMEELGQAMINVVLSGYEKKVLEVKDIREISRRK